MPPREPLTFRIHPSADVTTQMLQDSATLFSEEYGVWSPRAGEKMGLWCKSGARIKMSAQRLRQQSLRPGTDSVLLRCVGDGGLIGHAFATRWDVGESKVCWVTQLCVRRSHRRLGIATELLKHLKRDNEIFGIMSSHPGALMALSRALGSSSEAFEALDLSFIRAHGQAIFAASPVEYISRAHLRGSIFINHRGGIQVGGVEDEGGTPHDGSVCVADSGFWVDHTEPMAVLASVSEEHEWPLGELPEGCEWVVLVQ